MGLIRPTLILTTLLSSLIGLSTVGAGETRCESCVPFAGGSACSACGAGEKVCVTDAKPGTVEKHCWNVECEEVCIPAIRYPWHCWGWGKGVDCDSGACGDGCSQTGCGRVRVVRRLKKETYEEDVCEYEHRIECRCPVCCPVTQPGPAPHVESLPAMQPIAPPEEPAPAPQVRTPVAPRQTVDASDRSSLWTIMKERRTQ